MRFLSTDGVRFIGTEDSKYYLIDGDSQTELNYDSVQNLYARGYWKDAASLNKSVIK